jgi:hypothetical protein
VLLVVRVKRAFLCGVMRKRVSINPKPPAAIRITPTTLILIPATVVCTAKVRMAPKANRKTLNPMPMMFCQSG